MAKLPNIKKLVIEDYPEAKGWIEKLLQPINSFMESVYQTLNRGLKINDNMDGMVTDVEVTGANFPVSFKVTTKAAPRAVLVGNCKVKATGVAASIPQLTWEYTPASGQIKLLGASGLTSGTKYILTLVVFTE